MGTGIANQRGQTWTQGWTQASLAAPYPLCGPGCCKQVASQNQPAKQGRDARTGARYPVILTSLNKASAARRVMILTPPQDMVPCVA